MGPGGAGAARGAGRAEGAGPLRSPPDLGPPRPEPARHELELVLPGEADRAVDLVRDRSADSRGLADTDLGGRGLEPQVAPVGSAERVRRSDPRRGRVAGEDGEILLDRLELADRLPELAPLGRLAGRQREDRLEASRP